MRARKKLLLILAALGAFLIATLLVVPRLLHLDWLRARVIAEARERLGAEVGIEALGVSLLPVPRVVLDGVSFSLPDAADLRATRASIHPRLLPLLSGRAQIASVRLSGLDVAVHRPAEQAEEPTSSKRSSPLAGLRALVASQDPGISLVADGAHVSMEPGAADEMWVESADGVTLRIDAEEGDGGEIATRLDAEVASVRLRRGEESLELTGGRLDAALAARDERVTLDVAEMHLDDPAVELSGRLVHDPRGHQVSLAIEGRDLRVLPALAAAGFLVPGNGAVGAIDAVLHRGRVPEISVTVEGSSFADLARFELFRIEGRLEEGVVDLPLKGARLDNASGDVVIEKAVLTAKNVAAGLGTSHLRDASISVGLSGADRALQIDSGDTVLSIGELHSLAKNAGWFPGSSAWGKAQLVGTTKLSHLSIGGPVDAPRDWHADFEGSVDGLKFESAPWSGEVQLRKPASLPRARLRRENRRTTASGQAVIGDGKADFELISAPDRFELSHLTLRDGGSDATFHLVLADGEVEVGFAGKLLKETVDTLLITQPFLAGSVEGDFQTRLVPANPLDSTAKGRLVATDLTIPGQTRVHVQKLSLEADAKRFTFDADADAKLMGDANLSGTVQFDETGFVVDATARAGDVDLEQVVAAVGTEKDDSGEGRSAGESPWAGRLRGKVDVELASLRYGRFRWQPFVATVSLPPGGPVVDVRQAKTCGILTDGSAAFGPSGIELDAALSARGAAIEPSVTCLLDKKKALTGTFDLEATIGARGEAAKLARAVRGPVRFEARDGRIHRVPVIAETLAVVNVATGAFASVAELGRGGLPYDRVSLQGELRDGMLEVKEFVLDGPTVKLSGQGSVDLDGTKSNLTLIVAPLSTIDSAVDKIPVVGFILGGSLLSIPVRVSGDISAPKVTPLDPSAVGEELKGLMERTLRVPGRALRPLFPGKRKK